MVAAYYRRGDKAKCEKKKAGMRSAAQVLPGEKQRCFVEGEREGLAHSITAWRDRRESAHKALENIDMVSVLSRKWRRQRRPGGATACCQYSLLTPMLMFCCSYVATATVRRY